MTSENITNLTKELESIMDKVRKSREQEELKFFDEGELDIHRFTAMDLAEVQKHLRLAMAFLGLIQPKD